MIRTWGIVLCTLLCIRGTFAEKQPVHALYIPLADHYAAIVALELYGDEMQYAEFSIEKMKNWEFLRASFQEGNAEMAFMMAPLAMDMYHKKQNFRWIGLMHRDGNALAINNLFADKVILFEGKGDRKPSKKVAEIFYTSSLEQGSIEVGVPHLFSTHTVILYRFLKEHGLSLSVHRKSNAEVTAIEVAPPLSPAFIYGKSNKAEIAAFEQSLPWADIAETEKLGKIAWYSKDVMPWPNGHVECIAVATDKALSKKRLAVGEVMYYLKKAGMDIEKARSEGGASLDSIITVIRRHIPEHSKEAIIASLNAELRVINYENLDIDKEGISEIQKWALEGSILRDSIDIDAFAYDSLPAASFYGKEQ